MNNEFKDTIIDTLETFKCEEIKYHDMSSKNYITKDVFVASAVSGMQLKSCLEKMYSRFKQEHDTRDGVLDLASSDWGVLDLGYVMIHIFTTSAREYYDLDSFLSGY